MKYALFSIDGQADPLIRTAFLSYFQSKAVGNIVPCIGQYKGEREFSFLTLATDFDALVRDSVWYKDQESVMLISSCNKQYAQLEYRDGSTESLGSLRDVSPAEAALHDSWTYRIDEQRFWVSVKGNPDHAAPDATPVKRKRIALMRDDISFSSAFQSARAANADEFEWNRKRYNTKYAHEKREDPNIRAWRME